MLCAVVAVVALAGCSNDETSQTGELQDKVMGTASTVTFSTESSATQATTMTRTSINNFQSKVVFSKSKKKTISLLKNEYRNGLFLMECVKL